jgi:hypothetical protein
MDAVSTDQQQRNGDTDMTTKTPRTKRELAAMAFAIADEIETRAQPLIARGMNRDDAVMRIITQMAAR